MIYLLLSILASICIFIVFKLIAKNSVPVFQSIVVNYTVCIIMGVLLQWHFPTIKEIVFAPWFSNALILGGLFISIFYITARTVKISGVAVTTIASKLSLVIPIIAAYFLYSDDFNALKILGIFLALIAVVFAAYRKKDDNESHQFIYFFFPALVLLGGGVVDTFVKWNQEFFLEDGQFNLFLIIAFGTAAVIGWIVLSYRYLDLNEKLNTKSLGYGILLGIPNYGSMAFLLAALNVDGWQSSMVFPVNNIAIVVCSCLIATFIFKEKLSKLNFIGIALGVFAILLIMQSA